MDGVLEVVVTWKPWAWTLLGYAVGALPFTLGQTSVTPPAGNHALNLASGEVLLSVYAVFVVANMVCAALFKHLMLDGELNTLFANVFTAPFTAALFTAMWLG